VCHSGTTHSLLSSISNTFTSLFLAIQSYVGTQHQAGQGSKQNSPYLAGNAKGTLVQVRRVTAQGSTLVSAMNLFSILGTLWVLPTDIIAQVIQERETCHNETAKRWCRGRWPKYQYWEVWQTDYITSHYLKPTTTPLRGAGSWTQ